jgi:hypothetical protein
MRFMMTYKIKSENWGKAISRFLETGAPAPTGTKLVNRWHAAAGGHGFMLLEGTDINPIYQFAAEWGDLCDISITPVLEDKEAASVLTNMRK